MRPLLIVPMTGVSSRFTALGYDRPKFLLEVDGQLVIDHVNDMLPDWDDVIFICNPIHLDDPRFDLERHLLARRPKARVVRANGAQLGPGAAVLSVRELVDPDRPVVVNYCDFTVYWNSTELSDRLYSGEVDGVIPCYTGFHPHMAFSTSYAYVKMAGTQVADIQEKQPWTEDPGSEYASSGTYGFASGALLLDALDQQVEQQLLLSGEYYLSLTYKPMLAAGGRVEILEIQHFMQWGTPQDFEEYRETSRAIASWLQPRIVPDAVPQHPHSARVILASGAGQRFADAGYALPKPLLPLAGITVLEHALQALPGDETVVVTRGDLPGNDSVESLASQWHAHIVRLDGLSRGQAESALAGLRAIRGSGPVTVGACDALPTISRAAFDSAIDEAGEHGIVAWLATPLHAARRKPQQYGWAGTTGSRIDNVWIKADPSPHPAGVIIGTFSFPSARAAIEQIEALIADDERVNGEFYLDSLVGRALSDGRPAIALEVNTFASVGTPTEYESLVYWQSCLHKWAIHPYSLAGDPLVPATSRMTLDARFRRESAANGVSR